VEAPNFVPQVEVVTVTNNSLSTGNDLIINFALIPRQINQQAYLQNLNLDRESLVDDEQDYGSAGIAMPNSADYSDKHAGSGPSDDGEDLQNVLNLLRATPGQQNFNPLAEATDDRDVQEILKMLKNSKMSPEKEKKSTPEKLPTMKT
jgi:hypothetical protein